MGCTPTAQRLNSIPSCNVNASSKSTKSTVKNSDYMQSPKKLPLSKDLSNQKHKRKRNYSPKYGPTAKVKEQDSNTIGNHLAKQIQVQKSSNQNQKKTVANIDVVSHLSLNSQRNSKENLQFLAYHAKSPQKQTKKVRIDYNQTRHKKEPTNVKTLQNSRDKMTKSASPKYDILEKELRNMNKERFEKIRIEKRNF